MDYTKYKLAAQAVGFYDSPILNNGDPEPAYYSLFEWSPGYSLDNVQFGQLKEELFDTLDKKIAYLQGVFEDLSEGIGIIRGESWIQFANSQFKVERCKKWINEVALSMCEGKLISSNNENSYLLGMAFGGVRSHNIKYSIPICHHVEIDPEVVKYIKNYKFDDYE